MFEKILLELLTLLIAPIKYVISFFIYFFFNFKEILANSRRFLNCVSGYRLIETGCVAYSEFWLWGQIVAKCVEEAYLTCFWLLGFQSKDRRYFSWRAIWYERKASPAYYCYRRGFFIKLDPIEISIIDQSRYDISVAISLSPLNEIKLQKICD